MQCLPYAHRMQAGYRCRRIPEVYKIRRVEYYSMIEGAELLQRTLNTFPQKELSNMERGQAREWCDIVRQLCMAVKSTIEMEELVTIP